MKYLIILNRRFPYEYGEPFLENEIDEISPYFDKILIFPSDMTPQSSRTRTINSSNVNVTVYQKGSLKARNLKYLMGGIFHTKDKDAGSLRNRLYSGYFAYAAEQQAKKIWEILSQYDFKKEDQVVLYSYWLFINAKSVVSLKNKLEQITNVKCISRAHGFDVYEEKKYLPDRKYLLSQLDAVFPCSNYGTKYIQERYPQYQEKIQTSYLGTYDKGILLPQKQNTFRIVSCSRIVPEKRLDLLIDSLAGLKGCGIEMEWTHFGGGEGLDKIKKLAADKLGFMKVNFTGAISNQQVYENYAKGNFNVFLNCSSSEGLPVSIMEAISFGLPAVATNAGGTSEIVIDNVSGFLEPVNVKPEVLTKDILKIARMSTEEYADLRASARKHWENNFQAPVNYQKFVDSINLLFKKN